MDQRNLSGDLNDHALPSSTLATVSLISALLGFSFLPLLGGIVALFTGYQARKETRSVPPKAAGDGMATAGIIMGWIQAVILGVLLCCLALDILSYFLWAASGR
jgi:hypothetical protein